MLTWQAPTNAGGLTITNYTIYRGNSSGEETLYQVLGNQLNYTDTSIQTGIMYYYTVTANNSLGESGFSNEVHEIIPTQTQTVTTSSTTPSSKSTTTSSNINNSISQNSNTLLFPILIIGAIIAVSIIVIIARQSSKKRKISLVEEVSKLHEAELKKKEKINAQIDERLAHENEGETPAAPSFFIPTRQCVHCGQKVPIDSLFCTNCGREMD